MGISTLTDRGRPPDRSRAIVSLWVIDTISKWLRPIYASADQCWQTCSTGVHCSYHCIVWCRVFDPSQSWWLLTTHARAVLLKWLDQLLPWTSLLPIDHLIVVTCPDRHRYSVSFLFPYTVGNSSHVCFWKRSLYCSCNKRSAPLTIWQALYPHTWILRLNRGARQTTKLDNEIIEAATSTSLCVDQDHSSEPSLLTALHAGLRFP